MWQVRVAEKHANWTLAKRHIAEIWFRLNRSHIVIALSFLTDNRSYKLIVESSDS